MTSSPGPMPRAISAARIASVPDDMPTACFTPQKAAISFSRASTSGPRMKYCASATRSKAARISSRSGAYWALRSRSGILVMTGRKYTRFTAEDAENAEKTEQAREESPQRSQRTQSGERLGIGEAIDDATDAIHHARRVEIHEETHAAIG